ncbi:hypothetical protein ACK1JC_14075 [Acinetobacter sp. TY2]|uniref:hypothetical protein n=1 Tax=Acinetobacter sp. TY2 TaxID=3387403 RepID=UPI003917A439
MMTNTEALQAILSRVGTFTGMKKTNIQLANNQIVKGKPFEPPKGEIWVKITVKNAGSFISGIGNKPCTRTTGIVFIQLFAPLNSGTNDLSLLADKWSDHLQFYSVNRLEMLEANILDTGENNGYYQYNVNVAYRVN